MFYCEICKIFKNIYLEKPLRETASTGLHLQSLLREAVVRRYFVKKVFLKISQNSQKNTCARIFFLITFQAYNLGHNFLEIYNVLVQIRLTTSKT